VTAAHLLMKVMKLCRIMRRVSYIRIFLITRPLVIELLRHAISRITFIVNILRGLHEHGFDHMLLLLLSIVNDLRMALPLVRVHTPGI
jgi:hypothetical protein